MRLSLSITSALLFVSYVVAIPVGGPGSGSGSPGYTSQPPDRAGGSRYFPDNPGFQDEFGYAMATPPRDPYLEASTSGSSQHSSPHGQQSHHSLSPPGGQQFLSPHQSLSPPGVQPSHHSLSPPGVPQFPSPQQQSLSPVPPPGGGTYAQHVIHGAGPSSGAGFGGGGPYAHSPVHPHPGQIPGPSTGAGSGQGGHAYAQAPVYPHPAQIPGPSSGAGFGGGGPYAHAHAPAYPHAAQIAGPSSGAGRGAGAGRSHAYAPYPVPLAPRPPNAPHDGRGAMYTPDTGPRVYRCNGRDNCNYQTTDAAVFRKHQSTTRIHNPQGQIECPHCHERFARPQTYRDHVIRTGHAPAS